MAAAGRDNRGDPLGEHDEPRVPLPRGTPRPDLRGEAPSNALLTETHNVTPVELDQSYRIFRGRTRGDLGAIVSELGSTLYTNGGALRSGLQAAPGGLDQTSAVLRELGANQNALQTLVDQGNQVTSALASRQNDLGTLVDHAAATFNVFAAHTAAEQASLDQGPQALNTATSTLNRLNTSLTGLQTLVTDVAPEPSSSATWRRRRVTRCSSSSMSRRSPPRR